MTTPMGGDGTRPEATGRGTARSRTFLAGAAVAACTAAALSSLAGPATSARVVESVGMADAPLAVAFRFADGTSGLLHLQSPEGRHTLAASVLAAVQGGDEASVVYVGSVGGGPDAICAIGTKGPGRGFGMADPSGTCSRLVAGRRALIAGAAAAASLLAVMAAWVATRRRETTAVVASAAAGWSCGCAAVAAWFLA